MCNMFLRLRAVSTLVPLNLEIDFDFDFDSFVRGGRAGEVKLRADVRGVILLSLGLPMKNCNPPRRPPALNS